MWKETCNAGALRIRKEITRMSNQVSGTLTTNPSLEWIASEDADPKYFPADYNSEKVRRVRFSFRFDDYPIPVEVEVDGDPRY